MHLPDSATVLKLGHPWVPARTHAGIEVPGAEVHDISLATFSTLLPSSPLLIDGE